MADFWLYIRAVISNWFAGFWFLTAVPELLSCLAPEAWIGRVSRWADQRIKRDARRKIYTFVALLGIFVASFVAWDEQYQSAIRKSPEALSAFQRKSR